MGFLTTVHVSPGEVFWRQRRGKYYLYDSVHNGLVYMPSAGEQPNDGNYIIMRGVSMVEWPQRASGRLIDYEQHTSVEKTRFSKDTRGSP